MKDATGEDLDRSNEQSACLREQNQLVSRCKKSIWGAKDQNPKKKEIPSVQQEIVKDGEIRISETRRPKNPASSRK